MKRAGQPALLRLQEPGDGIGRKTAEILEWVRVKAAGGETPTAAEAAGHFELNRDYLGRIVKKSIGITLGQYINNVKIKKARELLVETDLYNIVEPHRFYISFTAC